MCDYRCLVANAQPGRPAGTPAPHPANDAPKQQTAPTRFVQSIQLARARRNGWASCLWLADAKAICGRRE